MTRRYLIPYTSANSLLNTINYLSRYFPIKINGWDIMTPAQQLIELRNANSLGINKGGIPGIYLEKESNIAVLTKPENYGKHVIFINQTSINRKWLDSKTLDGAQYRGKRYTMKEIESKIGKSLYIKNLPNKDEKTFVYYLKRLLGGSSTPSKKFKYIYTVNQIKKMIGGDFQVTDPWNNIPPMQLSTI